MLRVNTTIMHNAVVTKLPKAKTGVHMYTATLTKEMSPQSVKPSISNQINELIKMVQMVVSAKMLK